MWLVQGMASKAFGCMGARNGTRNCVVDRECEQLWSRGTGSYLGDRRKIWIKRELGLCCVSVSL